MDRFHTAVGIDKSILKIFGTQINTSPPTFAFEKMNREQSIVQLSAIGV